MESNNSGILREERLNRNKHFKIIGDFRSGADNPLDIFLTDSSFQYDEDKLGNTYLIFTGDKVVGYYTVKASGIQIINNEDSEPLSFPVVELARIAVIHTMQGIGIGKLIFNDFILDKVIKVSNLIAVKGIIAFVEDTDDKAVGFYNCLGFKKVSESVLQAIQEEFSTNCKLFLVSINNL